MGGLKDTLLKVITALLGWFDDNINEAVAILTMDLFSTSGTYAPMMNVVLQINTIVMPVALVICGICFFYQLINMVMTLNVLKWEFFAKALFSIVLARTAMYGLPLLMRAIYGTSAEWIANVWGGGNSDLSLIIRRLTDIIAGMSWGQALGFVAVMSLPLLLIVGVSFAVRVMAYARIFELLFWIAVAPIACAFIPLEDNRIAKQFIFRFAGTALSGLAIIICIRLYFMFNISILSLAPSGNDEMSAVGILLVLLLGAVLLGVCTMKSGSWAKSLFDAS